MEWLLLACYLVLPALTFVRTRSLSWTVIMVLTSISVFGVGVSFGYDHGTSWTRQQLQWVLLAALVVPAVLAFIRRPAERGPVRLQVIGILVPVAALTTFFFVMTTWWTARPAYLDPVAFLMGHSIAEDNAKWLDFASGLASGLPIDQDVPMGGPLQLVLVFVATLMGVVSSAKLGGYNQVMVAADTVVFAQYMLVVLAPLALAPIAEALLRRPSADGARGRTRVPWPLVWLGSLVLVSTNLMLTAYGHLTLQYTIIVTAVWVGAFLTWSKVPRAALLTSLTVAAGMTVWLPMNVIGAVLIVGWLAVLIARGIRGGRTAFDWVGIALTIVVGVAIWEPLKSSLSFVVESTPTAAGTLLSGLGGGIHAAVGVARSVPFLSPIFAGVGDSTLFAAGGGTEQTTALLATLAAVASVATAVVASRQVAGRQGYARFIPVLLLAGFALTLNVLDQWATGSAPHYGSLKFTFMVIIVVAGTCLPLALLLLDPRARAMTLARWVAVGAVIMVLVVDSLLVRSIAAARPDQWSPPIPFNNPQSYWWPAEVDGSGDQPIATNPVACVYLPQGAKAPSAILDSQLSDPQRVYSCTRLLAGLAGNDTEAQPIVDWLRREWLTNTRAWTDVYGYLAGMPDEVLDKPVILLDDGSNVIGLETMRSLLGRYPATAGQ